MAYQVLARKYRPQRFADVIGQDHVTQTLLNALGQDRIAHGYIFSGHRGIGKTTIARILAMALQCRTARGTSGRPTPEPCGTCEACLEIRSGNAIDVIEIDAATNRGIDEIRELREGARYSPARDKYKIYILDEAHQITDAAFNALLKTLEEPPAHVVFMMATTQPEDIPQTIRSRCQHFSFHAVRFQDIVEQLRSIARQESIETDDAALSLLAEAGDGSMRDALSIMDQAIASAPLRDGKHVLDGAQIRGLMGTVSNQVFESMMGAVLHRDASSMLGQCAQLLDAGNGPQPIARQMVRFLRNCLMARVAGKNSELLQISEEERARAGRIAAQFSEEDLSRFLNSMLRTFDDLGYRQEQRFHLELGLLKLVHMQRLLPFEELFRQFSGGPGTPHAPNSGQRTDNPGSGSTQVQSKVANSASTPKKPAETNITSNPLEGMFAQNPGSSMPMTPSAAKQAPSAPPSPPASRPTVPAAIAAPIACVAEIDNNALRSAICQAMARGGHETASAILEAGNWNWDGNELQICITTSKTLLNLTYSPDAQRIVRDTFRQISGSSRPVRVEVAASPEDSHEDSGAKKIVQSAAAPASEDRENNAVRPQDHPLIRYAQQLFGAEIRSVVSLRESR